MVRQNLPAENATIPRNTQSGISPTTLRDYQTTIMILENISDAILILNKKGQVEYCNHSALEMIGAEYAACHGRPIAEIMRLNEEETLPGETASGGIIENLPRDICGNFTARFLANGHYVPVVVNINPVAGKDGAAELFIVTAKNMSGRKLYEKEMRNVQAASISLNYLRSIRQLSIDFVHEFSQPLAAFQMRMEMLGPQLPEKYAAEIGEMNRLLDRMRQIVDRIRNYADHAEVNYRTPVRFSEIIKNALNVFAYEFSEEKINVTIVPADECTEIPVNPVSMEQVFVSLLANARESFLEMDKRRKSSAIVKTIDLFIRNEGEKWLEIFVDDNAAGINPKIRDRIFEPFFTTKKTDRNPGLGLTVAKNILNSLGGDIQLIEKNGPGTCLVVRLPLIQSHEQDQLFNLIEMLHTK